MADQTPAHPGEPTRDEIRVIAAQPATVATCRADYAKGAAARAALDTAARRLRGR
ncbi:hypothetical protein [Streptomyces sp. NPDC050504]|uniref:hypothetical protein n=1 Tax=Streptomyces sp. NPDC050504 TaxID=3365618 RepID=UPI00378F599B